MAKTNRRSKGNLGEACRSCHPRMLGALKWHMILFALKRLPAFAHFSAYCCLRKTTSTRRPRLVSTGSGIANTDSTVEILYPKLPGPPVGTGHKAYLVPGQVVWKHYEFVFVFPRIREAGHEFVFHWTRISAPNRAIFAGFPHWGRATTLRPVDFRGVGW